MTRLIAMLLLAAALIACEQRSSQQQVAHEVELTDADVADNNRGVALMGYFDYAGAREVFDQLVARQQHWHEARVNLAIATLNRQEQGDEARALALVEQVLEEDPAHLRAHYISGLLRLYLGEAEAARDHFETVVDGDPHDAYAAYYLGQSLVQLGEVDNAIVQYRRAMELDPYLRSAYYGAALALRRSGNTEEATQLLEDYQRFENNPRARLAEFKYTRMGPKGTALAIGRPAAPAPQPVSGDVFGRIEGLPRLPSLHPRSSMTTADINADGVQDLYVTRVGQQQTGAVLLGGARMSVTDHPLAAVARVNAVAWGDIDNDGQLDVYLCREGPNQLWRRASQWSDVTGDSGTDNGDLDCADVQLVDADHDGDLDIFVVNRDAPNELYNNNGNGTFRPLAAEYGIAGRAGSRHALVGDLDNDRDLDLVVIKNEPPHEVYLNDRLWQYRPQRGVPFATTDINAATLGDTDTDGRMELFALDNTGALSRWPAWDAAQSSTVPGSGGNAGIALMDFDGDGQLDVFRHDSGGWTVAGLDGRLMKQEKILDGSMVAALPAYLTPGNGPEVVSALQGGQLLAARAGSGRYPFVSFTFSGKEEQADSMRSNRDGIGTRVELRIGSRWTIVDTLDRHSAPGQSLQPLMLGTGGAGTVDYVALTWSDGVFQTELDLPAGELHAIEETQRQLSSCPVLFAWDGERYRFVTDLLGVGGIGFFVKPGVAATPRPWEYLLLPDGLLQPRDGRLVFKLTEPMEELAYIDSVRLHTYDLPAGVTMVMDERMVITGPPASGDALYYSSEVLPLQAINDRGEDVTRKVIDADRKAAPVGARDKRFIGRLAGEHELTLEFAEPLDRSNGTPVLIVDGWVEYPYSQTVFAAWQADEFYAAPTLEAFGRDGRWRTVYPAFGYPAGMPRRMALPMPDLPPGTMRLRLRTNLEVYWDRIAVAHTHAAAPDRASRAPLYARQLLSGFPRRTTAAQRLPDYDYGDRDTFWDTRYPKGLYSAFGSVTELVQRTDDAVAVIGPGEEIEFSFSAGEPPATGRKRHYVLEVRGWAKDMDLYTQSGGTVGPLPLRDGAAGTDRSRDELHRRYHTRYQGGR